ncbi:hypothetical protein UY3_09646 [Chelonia mydas]|uniref:Uncharacterized protein n=1 Tax=Chelonia mydas TaxID=8469 RepID=M7BYN4_CHEMY|nr:hypothetical protein UY3_09646 [Chelonia mydas]
MRKPEDSVQRGAQNEDPDGKSVVGPNYPRSPGDQTKAALVGKRTRVVDRGWPGHQTYAPAFPGLVSSLLLYLTKGNKTEEEEEEEENFPPAFLLFMCSVIVQSGWKTDRLKG